MALTIELPPEVTAHLRAEATRRNKSAEDYAREVLERELPLNEPLPFWATATKEEWLRAFHEWIESHRGMNLPVLPEEAYSRESIYGDKGVARL